MSMTRLDSSAATVDDLALVSQWRTGDERAVVIPRDIEGVGSA